MEGKTLSGEFPISGFQKLARLLDEENDVFQRHVVDLVRDSVEDADLHRNSMEMLREKFSEKDISDFLESVPAEKGHYLRPGPVQDLVTLTENLKGSHVTPADVAQMVAVELIYRKRWEKTMADNPETLQALKNKLGS